MVRNLYMRNFLLLRPTRSWMKKIGPDDVSFTREAVATNKGASTMVASREIETSRVRLTRCCQFALELGQSVIEMSSNCSSYEPRRVKLNRSFTSRTTIPCPFERATMRDASKYKDFIGSAMTTSSI